MSDESTPDAEPTVGALRHFLDGRWAWIRDEVRQTIAQPLFAPVYGIGVEEHRERVLEQAKALADTPGPRLLFPKELGGDGEIGAAVTAFETQALGDLSLLVKSGVQWGLFGGAILHLGTERHHRAYIADVISLRLPGCFAMTETGHGSDVQSIRTTATYDADTDEFVIHTPDDSAVKDYIGNAAHDGRMAVVFAQLCTPGADGEEQRNGVHALLVPIRDDAGSPCPGVSIEDCGHKMGLNGVDNGRLAFNQVRVPRDALLDRYGTVDAGRRLLKSHRERDASLLHNARDARARSRVGLRRLAERIEGRARDRGPLRTRPPPVPCTGQRRRSAHPRLSATPATAAARARHYLCAAFRPGRARRATARGVLEPRQCLGRRGGRRRACSAQARNAGGRHQGHEHLACDRHDPDVS